jgi:hypothetical protein
MGWLIDYFLFLKMMIPLWALAPRFVYIVTHVLVLFLRSRLATAAFWRAAVRLAAVLFLFLAVGLLSFLFFFFFFLQYPGCVWDAGAKAAKK